MKEEQIKILIFVINNQYYAADIMEIERIIKYSEPIKIPESPDFVEGVIKYEGNVLPVISLTKRFNMPTKKADDDSKIIVTRQDDKKIGIVVDFVSEVKNITTSIIEEEPDTITGISKRYLKGLIKLNNNIVIFLNLSEILTDEERDNIIR